MRPKSILWFERLFWLAFALDALTIGLFDFPDPEMGIFGSLILYGIALALSALLWLFIAIKASRIAKWIFILLTLVDVGLSAALPEEFSTGGPLDLGLSLASSLLGLLCCAFLFRADSRRWFANRGVGDVDPKIFT